jgi:hypothetical protein
MCEHVSVQNSSPGSCGARAWGTHAPPHLDLDLLDREVRTERLATDRDPAVHRESARKHGDVAEERLRGLVEHVVDLVLEGLSGVEQVPRPRVANLGRRDGVGARNEEVGTCASTAPGTISLSLSLSLPLPLFPPHAP